MQTTEARISPVGFHSRQNVSGDRITIDYEQRKKVSRGANDQTRSPPSPLRGRYPYASLRFHAKPTPKPRRHTRIKDKNTRLISSPSTLLQSIQTMVGPAAFSPVGQSEVHNVKKGDGTAAKGPTIRWKWKWRMGRRPRSTEESKKGINEQGHNLKDRI